MKVYIHAYTEGMPVNGSPFIVAEMETAPMVHDKIWLSHDQQRELEEKIIQYFNQSTPPQGFYAESLYGESSIRAYWNEHDCITPEMFARDLSLKDFIFVVDRLYNFIENDNFPKGLHINIYKEDERK